MIMTKRITISLFLGLIIVLPQIVFAQTGFTINYLDVSPVEIDTMVLNELLFDVINTATEEDSIRLLYLDDQFTVPEEWIVTFCADNSCYPPFVRGTAVHLGVNDTCSVSIDISPGRIEGTGSIFMHVSSVNDPEVFEVVEYAVLTTDVPETFDAIPETFSVKTVYPNPFNAKTTLEFILPQAAPVEMKIFSIEGREIYETFLGTLKAGENSIVINMPGNVSSGTYFIKLNTPGQSIVTRSIYLK
jgi:Secretion system C-terminal sorting domain